MRVLDFDFDLPETRIALRPSIPREAARLLVVDPENLNFEDKNLGDLIHFLRKGDALVVNDTKVIRARLKGIRTRGEFKAKIEVLLHQRIDASTWRAFIRPAKKLAAGEKVVFQNNGNELSAKLLEKGNDGEVVLQFNHSGPALDGAIEMYGELPLPPYIMAKRSSDAQDVADYQTIFAKAEGAVAAPTAGLHITENLLAKIREAGVNVHMLTLHVGAGTFLPVKADDTEDHIMHAEWGNVSPETANALNVIRKNNGRIIAVGTTSLRLLESATSEDGQIKPFSGETRIFITPGYKFRAVDALLTNFHLPKSTLFMLVSAFCGLETMKKAYAHAITTGYRFYSYGDASLLLKARS